MKIIIEIDGFDDLCSTGPKKCKFLNLDFAKTTLSASCNLYDKTQLDGIEGPVGYTTAKRCVKCVEASLDGVVLSFDDALAINEFIDRKLDQDWDHHTSRYYGCTEDNEQGKRRMDPEAYDLMQSINVKLFTDQ